MELSEWHLFPETPALDGFYEVRYPDMPFDGERFNWALGHWYDSQGRIRREVIDWRGSAEPLHAANCAVNNDPSLPGSKECDCFLSRFNG